MTEFEDPDNALDLLPASIRERLEGDCAKHPASLALDCQRCAKDGRSDEQAEVAAEALTRCVEKLPIRYRQAETQEPRITQWVRKFQQDPKNTPSLLLLGATGTGKTYLAYAALKAAVRVAWTTRAGAWRSPRWQALTYADLCASMRPRGREYDTEQVLKGYLETDLLLIDDLGAGKVSEAVEEVTYRLINGRYNDMRPSIFTSNLSLPALKEAIGDRVASRLSETCTRVVLEGPDRRRFSAA